MTIHATAIMADGNSATLKTLFSSALITMQALVRLEGEGHGPTVAAIIVIFEQSQRGVTAQR